MLSIVLDKWQFSTLEYKKYISLKEEIMKKSLVILIMLLMLIPVALFAKGEGEATDKPINLTVGVGYPEFEPYFLNAAKTFKEKHPNVTITVVSQPLRQWEQKLAATIPAGTSSDIICSSHTIMRMFISGGFLKENPGRINEFLNDPSRFNTTLVDHGNQVDGKYYGVPYFGGGKALYYNTDMFEAAGITEPPKTFDELAEAAKKLVQYDAKGNMTVSGHSLRLSGSGSGTGEKFWMFLHPMGGSIIEEGAVEGTYHAGYDNAAGQKALAFYLDGLYTDKWDSHKIKHDAEAFELGLTAMFFRESWVIKDIEEKAPDLNYATYFMPKDERWGTQNGYECLYVSDNCKNPEVAWDFVLECLNAENQQFLLEEIGWIPARLDVDYSSTYAKTPQLRAFTEMPDGYVPYVYPSLDCFDEILTKFASQITNFFLDKSLAGNPEAIKKAMHQAALETNSILEREGIYGK